MNHIVSNNIKTNKINYIIENELKFYSSNSLANDHVKYKLAIVTIRLRGGKNDRQNLNLGLICLWDIGSNESTTKRKNINIYKYKLRANKVEYSTSAGPYKTTHDAKVTFRILEFPSSKIITHRLPVDNMQGYLRRHVPRKNVTTC